MFILNQKNWLAAVSMGGAGALVGALAWGNGSFPILMLLVPFVWATLQNPWPRAMWVVGYWLGAEHTIYHAVNTFYQNSDYSVVVAMGFWLGSALVACLPWLIATYLLRKPSTITEDTRPEGTIKALLQGKPATGLIAVGLLAIDLLPPFEMMGLTNPLVGLGWFLPGYGWVGIAFYGLLVMAFGLSWPRYYRASAIILITVTALLVQYEPSEKGMLGSIFARSTHQGPLFPSNAAVKASDRMTLIGREIPEAAAAGVKTLIYPEGFLGDWDTIYQFLWNQEIRDKARKYGVLVGVGMNLPMGDGQYQNTLVLDDGTKRHYLHARNTTPIVMNHPWETTGNFPADWTSNRYLQLDGQRVLVFFCHEEVLTGNLLWDIAHNRPDIIFTVANSWFSPDGALNDTQMQHTEGIAKLFKIKQLRAVNY